MNNIQLRSITNEQLIRKIRCAEKMKPTIRRATGMTSDRIVIMYKEVQRRMLAGEMEPSFPADFD